jgi:ribonuclease HI
LLEQEALSIIGRINLTFMKDLVTIYTDGGSRGNPGIAACGIVFYNFKKEIIKVSGKYLGTMTNNQAEYYALLTALKTAQYMQVKNISFCLDSELVVKQMLGLYKVKNEGIRKTKAQIDVLIHQFDKVIFTHVLREQNKIADQIVNIILDTAENFQTKLPIEFNTFNK